MNENIKKVVRRALFGSAMAFVGITSSYLTSKLLVETAVEREMPKPMTKMKDIIAGRKDADDDDFMKELDKGAEWLSAQKNETIEIKAQDGTTLRAHLITVKHPKRLIIAMHGWRSVWYRDFGTVAEAWFACDSSVLFVEQRGQNDSEVNHMGFGLSERFDCQDWARYLENRFGRRYPIYLAGVSMGAATVLMASGLEMPKNVKGIIADCGFTSPKAIWKHVIKNNLHMGGFGLAQHFADDIFKDITDMELDEYSTVDALKTTNIPVLFIHGSSDPFVPVEMTYENYLACNSEKELLIVPGAGHGMSHYVETEKYENTVLDFFKKHDR